MRMVIITMKMVIITMRMVIITMKMVIITMRMVMHVITDHHYEGGDYHEHLCDKSDQSR